MKFISYDKTAEVLQPGKKPFHFPAPAIAPQCPPILSLAPITPVGGDHLYPPILFQFGIELITVVGFVADEPLRQFVGKTPIQGRFNQRHLMRRRACHVYGERKTSSVCNCHDLGALAALCFTNGTTPFFAGANVPSIKASRKSSPPRSFRSSANTISTASKAPSFRHRWNHLWQVWYGGYLSGKSFQGAPVLRIQNMPFKTIRRSLLTGLPRSRGSWGALHSKGAMRSHCSLVMSIPNFRKIGETV